MSKRSAKKKKTCRERPTKTRREHVESPEQSDDTVESCIARLQRAIERKVALNLQFAKQEAAMAERTKKKEEEERIEQIKFKAWFIPSKETPSGTDLEYLGTLIHGKNRCQCMSEQKTICNVHSPPSLFRDYLLFDDVISKRSIVVSEIKLC